MFTKPPKRFAIYFHFLNFTHLSLGGHIHLASPNIEIHLPFFFIRIGWQHEEKFISAGFMKQIKLRNKLNFELFNRYLTTKGL